MRSENIKGYLFALLATIAFSNVYIFSKAALNEVHIIQFGVYWFFFSTVLITLYAYRKGRLAQIRYLTKRQKLILITLAVLEILTTSTFFLSVSIIPDPAVTSFLGNLFPVMLAAGGVVILHEKFGLIETGGAALALAGAFVISYTGETSLEKLFIPGTGVVVLNAIFASAASLVVKVHVKKLSPELLSLNRSANLFVFSFAMMLISGQSFIVPLSAVKNIAIGATLGPFLAILAVYYSFSYLDVARSSVVQSLKGIFVLAGAYLMFGSFPQPHQVAGGLITVAGVLLMTLPQSGFLKRGKRLNPKDDHDSLP
jgi:drug/metabolite transporter (DMT)-like permease